MAAPLVTTNNDTWKSQYKKMKRKCREIERDNVVLSKKIRSINQVVEQVEIETKFLKSRLKFYSDDYTLPMSPKTRARTLLRTQAQLANDRLQSREPITGESQVTTNEVAPTSSKPVAKSKSRSTGETSVKKSSHKTDKLPKERDPNAPKKPANAFFWFCQEKRSEVQDRLAREGNVGHHDLTKVLSKMWGEVQNSDKKHYRELYEEDKRRYEKQQKAYMLQKDNEAYMLQKDNEASKEVTTARTDNNNNN